MMKISLSISEISILEKINWTVWPKSQVSLCLLITQGGKVTKSVQYGVVGSRCGVRD